MSKTAKPSEFCWNELMTGDVEQCKKFYSTLLGWEAQDQDMGNCNYTLFTKDGINVGGMMQLPEEISGHVPPHWMSYVLVDDVEATVAKAKSLGATIKKEPTSCGDFGRFAVLEDPAGAHLALWQSLKSC